MPLVMGIDGAEAGRACAMSDQLLRIMCSFLL